MKKFILGALFIICTSFGIGYTIYSISDNIYSMSQSNNDAENTEENTDSVNEDILTEDILHEDIIK